MTDPNNPYGSQPEQGYSQQSTGQLGYDQQGQPGSAPLQPQAGQPLPQGYYTPMALPGQQRPTGVTIIAVWNWILAGLFGLLGVLYMLLGGTIIGLGAGVGSGEAAPVGGIFGVIGGLFLVAFLFIAMICGLLTMSGLGLWRLRNSGRILTIIFYGLNLVFNLLAVGGGSAGAVTYIFLAISIAIIGYLFMPDVRKLFTRSR